MATIRKKDCRAVIVGRLARHLEHQSFMSANDTAKRIWPEFTPYRYFVMADNILFPTVNNNERI